MKARQLFKLGAGAGLATMLLGALLVLAPGAGATQGSVEKVTICHRTNSVTNPYRTPEIDFSGADGTAQGPDHTGHGGSVFNFGAADAPGYKTTYPTPRNGDQWGDIIPPVPYGDGQMTAGLNWYVDNDPEMGANEAGQAIWRNGCQEPETQGDPPVVIVEKVVPDIQSVDMFKFSVDGADEIEIGDGDSEEFEVQPGAVTVAENLTTPSGYTLQSVTCAKSSATQEDAPLGVQPVEGAVGFSVADGDIVTCVFTNVPVDQPEEPELIVRKVVTGVNAPPTWDFDFELCEEQGEVSLAAVTEFDCEFTLSKDNAQTPDAEHEETFPAGVYDITELDDDNLSSIVCTQGGVTVRSREGNSSTITGVDATEADVLCVFTNDFPGGGGGCVSECGPPPPPPPPPVTSDACPNLIGDQVAGTNCFPRVPVDVCPDLNGVQQEVDECIEVLPTPPVVPTEPEPEVEPAVQPRPVVQPTAAVRGDVVARPQSLPRTGEETRGLAGVGGFMLLVGAALVLGSKRQLAQR